MEVRVKENSWIAKIAAKKLRASAVAIVLGQTIHLYNTSAASFLKQREWVCHELKHVEQYKRFGIVCFIVRYVVESIRNGYFDNKYEIEARAAESEFNLLQEVKFITRN